MRSVIVYASTHHGNTKKVVEAIAQECGVELVDATKVHEKDLSEYDLVGFASGIFYSKFAEPVLKFARENLPENKDVFYIYTYGAPVSGFLKGIREIAEKKHCRELGAYHCLGFDTFGPFKLVGGIAKGHPTEEEIAGATKFYREL